MWNAPRLSLGVLFFCDISFNLYLLFIVFSHGIITSGAPELVKTDLKKLFFNHLKESNPQERVA
jgi:hypothetical protein